MFSIYLSVNGIGENQLQVNNIELHQASPLLSEEHEFQEIMKFGITSFWGIEVGGYSQY